MEDLSELKLWCTALLKAFSAALWTVAIGGAFSTALGYNANDVNKTIGSDGSLSDTQAAINYVANKNEDGWVLTVGSAGSAYTWSSQLSVSIPHVFTVQGASPINPPSINSTSTGGQAVSIKVADGKTVTVKDLNIANWNTGNTFFLVTGTGINCYRFTNITFSNTSNVWSIWISYPGDSTQGVGPYGLIDHCKWSNSSAQGIFVRDCPNATPNSWHRAMTFGSVYAVYLEDCSFMAVTMYPNARVAADGDNGCRIVFRHNKLQDFCISNHGADSSGPVNSGLQYEVLHNTWTMTDKVAQDFAIQFRGGSAVVSDNTFNGIGNSQFNSMLKLSYFRASVGGGGVCTQDRFYPVDYLGTQQPGSGVVNPPNAANQDPHYLNEPWGSVPVYVWGNHLNTTPVFGEVVTGLDSAARLFIQLSRDYFTGTAKPGYSEFTYPHPLNTAGSKPNPPSNLHVN